MTCGNLTKSNKKFTEFMIKNINVWNFQSFFIYLPPNLLRPVILSIITNFIFPIINNSVKLSTL